MYLNMASEGEITADIGLTVTLDVFKSMLHSPYCPIVGRLTVTLDVFRWVSRKRILIEN